MSRPALMPLRPPLFHALALLCAATLFQEHSDAAGPPAKVDFNRDVRPILSDKCFVCHGPDSARRKADLRLDQRESAIAEREGQRAIVPGNARTSQAITRILSTDADELMPPPSSTLKLTTAEIELLKRWIDEGAEYQPHWAFIPPRQDPAPITRQAKGAFSPIDSFIRVRLDKEGLTASAEADRSTLLRRISFDLTGLPPTTGELDEFIADPAPDAYEKQVDRLLASPRFGERMATNWLDAARYSDTNGYQTDGPRFMWRWRDWVIDAFNQNQPFDSFTIDQLAGDLIRERDHRDPGSEPAVATSGASSIADSRLIATGFNRNHRGNAEGGIIPEEFRVEYVVDRVETTGTVWLGLTIGCARCHDHKYDPVSQREFYQLFAFFNQVPEPGKYIRNDNSMPYLPAPTAVQQQALTALERERAAADSAWQAMEPAVRSGMEMLRLKIREQSTPIDWSVNESLDLRVAFDGDTQVERSLRSTGVHHPARGQSRNAKRDVAPDGTAAFVWRDGEGAFTSGRFEQSAQFDGRRWIEIADAADFGEDEAFVISCWIMPTSAKAMTVLARMDHDNSSRGYELRHEANGRLQALFSGRILDDLIRIETKTSLPGGQWSHVLVSYDGSSAARGVSIRINGEPVELTVVTDLLSNPIRVKRPLCVGAGGSAAPFIGQIDELRCFRGRLTAALSTALASANTISQIASQPLDETSPRADRVKFQEFYLAEHAPEAQRLARLNSLDARSRYDAFLATIPTTMVMEDARQKRPTFLLKRGEYDKPGEPVEPGFPEILPSVLREPVDPASGHAVPTNRLDRLDLARWIVSADNPLTARVTVNRLWQSLFGVGLVKTAEDFGTQGEAPSHPDLLDWLALEFQGDARKSIVASTLPNNRAWDVKHALRQMMTSATYRQSSQGSPTDMKRDPDNRWLARGPRFRLPAEMIRDAALAAGGMLVERLGGRSVKPYQPPGLWEELSADAVPGPFSIYVQDHGPDLYRRSLYTYRRRTVPPPSLALFDASPREACRVSLPRTNTPLQALSLMNDVTYVEAARVLAEAAMKDGGASAPSRLAWSFRRILSRAPLDRELKVLVDGFQRRWKSYQSHPDEAEQILKLGELPADPSLARDELAAYTVTISVIFNLDEFVTKP